MFVQDYNKTLFQINKINESKKIAKKNKAKAKAKATATANANIDTSVINTQIQPIYKTKKIQPMYKTKKIKPSILTKLFSHTTTPTQNSMIGIRIPLISQGIVPGTPEWYDYTGFTPPPPNYGPIYEKIFKEMALREKQGIEKQKASKISTPLQKLNPRVLIITLEYPGTQFKLNGCYNDADKFKAYILSLYPNAEITFLTDKPSLHDYDITLPTDNDKRWPSYNDPTFPTHDIVLKAITDLCKSPNRLLFLFLAGHGGAEDNFPAPIENTLVDIDSNGVIKNTFTVSNIENPKKKSTYYFCNDYGEMNLNSPLYDYEMYKELEKVSSTQKMYIFTDCCHSGTIFNLPFVNLGNFMYEYDSSGNIITQTMQETDDFGHGVNDSAGNPILYQSNVYDMLNDISNNVGNRPLTNTDIDNLMTDATTEVSYWDKLAVPPSTKSNTKISFKSAKFPSLANMKGDIIHFSGTRDNKFSYESIIYDSSKNIVDIDGAFTWRFKSLWDLGLENFTLKKAYTCLIGLINNPDQIPVLCTSKLSLFNDTDLLTDFTPQLTPASTPASTHTIKNKKAIVTELTKIKKLINNKASILNYYDSEKIKNVLNAKNIFKPVSKPPKKVVKKAPKIIKKKLNKKQEKIAKNIRIAKLVKFKE